MSSTSGTETLVVGAGKVIQIGNNNTVTIDGVTTTSSSTATHALRLSNITVGEGATVQIGTGNSCTRYK